MEQEIIDHAVDKLEDGIGVDQHGADLHHFLFNEDYFIIGYYQAEEFLKNGPGIFQAIEEIKTYENNNFGEVNTDFSDSEKVANMYAYIKGEELLSKSSHLQAKWDVLLNEKDLKIICEEISQ